MSGRLVALGASAVLAVYAAGYSRTRAAADRIARAAEERRPVVRGLVSPGAQREAAAPTTADAQDLPASPESSAEPAERPSASREAVPVANMVAEAAPARTLASKTSDAAHEPTSIAADPLTATTTHTPPADADSMTAATSAAVASHGTAVSDGSAVVAAPVASIAASAVSTSLPSAPSGPAVASAYKDGTYLGWGTCRHGDIQASVVVAGGHITSASISQCATRYPCSWISMLPGQVVTRQSPNVDYVSGATQSAEAFYGAVVDALSKAK